MAQITDNIVTALALYTAEKQLQEYRQHENVPPSLDAASVLRQSRYRRWRLRLTIFMTNLFVAFDRPLHLFLRRTNATLDEIQWHDAEGQFDECVFVSSLWRLYEKQLLTLPAAPEKARKIRQQLLALIRTITRNNGYRFNVINEVSIEQATRTIDPDCVAALAHFFAKNRIKIEDPDAYYKKLLRALQCENRWPADVFKLLDKHLSVAQLIDLKQLIEGMCEKLQLKGNYNALFQLTELINHKNQFAQQILHPEIQQTIQMFEQHTGWHVIFGSLARTIAELIGWQRSERNLYRFILMLKRANLFTIEDEEILQQYSAVEPADENICYYHTQQALLNYFYHKFERLAQANVDAVFLKSLKKHIHHFAEANGFRKQLFNIDKVVYYKRYHHDIAIVTGADDQAGRKYAYFANHINYVTSAKRARRDLKFVIQLCSNFLAFVLGLSEAIIAFTFLGSASVFWRITTFISGLVSNYILFYRAIFDTTHSLVFRGFFTDANGQRTSIMKKVFITLSASFCIGSGVGFGILTYMSVVSILTKVVIPLLLAAGLAFPPSAVVIIATVLTVLSAIGTIYLFMNGFSRFVKDDGYLKVKEYFIEKFSFAHCQTRGDYIKHLGNCFIRSLCLLATFGAWLCLAGAGGPFFANAIKNVFHGMFHLAAKFSNVAGKTISYGLSTPMNSFFAAEGMFKAADIAADFIISLPTRLTRVCTQLSKWAQRFAALPLRKVFTAEDKREMASDLYQVKSAVRNMVLVALPIANATGQMRTFPSSAESVAVVTKITQLPSSTVKEMLNYFGFFGSYGPNTVALLDTFQNVANRGVMVNQECVSDLNADTAIVNQRLIKNSTI